MQTPYVLLGGEEGVKTLAYTFYDVMDELKEAEDIRHMHNQALDDIKQKLFEYLSGWLGGPHLYQQKYGTVCLTSPHKKFQINEAARDQWLLCMDKTLERVGASDEVISMLKKPMFDIADMLTNDKS